MSPWNDTCVQGREETIQHELLSSYCICVPVTLSRISKLVSTLSVSVEGARFKMSMPRASHFLWDILTREESTLCQSASASSACFINVPLDKAIPVADEEGRNRSEKKRSLWKAEILLWLLKPTFMDVGELMTAPWPVLGLHSFQGTPLPS